MATTQLIIDVPGRSYWYIEQVAVVPNVGDKITSSSGLVEVLSRTFAYAADGSCDVTLMAIESNRP